MTITAADGRQLWRVEVTEQRTGFIYVLADTEEQARADADELVSGYRSSDWDDIETDHWVARAEEEPALDRWVWTGGPQGDDKPWSELRRG